MSRDPIRLVDLRDLPSSKAEFMRDVIRAQLTVRPSDEKMEELASRLAPLFETAPAPARPAPWLGVAAAAVASAVLVVGIYWTTHEAKPDRPRHPSSTASAPAQPVDRMPPHSAELEPPPAVPVDALPSVQARRARAAMPASPPPRCDDVTLVDAADTELRAGNPDAALALAREHERRCPAGALVQERERIAIEALLRLGRVDQARARARAFEARFPSSPHVGRIREALDRPPR